jgi:hypothetical protein
VLEVDVFPAKGECFAEAPPGTNGGQKQGIPPVAFDLGEPLHIVDDARVFSRLTAS